MIPPAIVIAGAHSGSGKTTTTLAILAALRRRGLAVQGFKVGPDFLDPGHHSAITGRSGRNLDSWLLDPPMLAESYRRGSIGADISVIEGVMGLFDGRGARDEAGSTADLARRLGLPVVLVVDARGMARSIAPMVEGFRRFDARVEVVGAIANRVGSTKHYKQYLEPALAADSGVEPLGYLLRDERLAIPSRHLGLMAAEEFRPGSEFLARLADAAESTLDLDRLIGLARVPTLDPAEPPPTPALPHEGGGSQIGGNPPAPSSLVGEGRGGGYASPNAVARIAVARDEAFCFYYEDNFDLLRDAGAEIVFFSPLHDDHIPADCGLVYLGGGYPELFAARIAENNAMKAAIVGHLGNGGTIFAECGGLMACCRALRDISEQDVPMWDLIPAVAVMRKRFAALGYVTVVADRATPFGPAGTTLRGHEFHYSSLEPLAPLPYATRLLRPDGPDRPDGIQIGRLFASYAHVHLGSNPKIVAEIVKSAS